MEERRRRREQSRLAGKEEFTQHYTMHFAVAFLWKYCGEHQPKPKETLGSVSKKKGQMDRFREGEKQPL